MKSYLLGFLGFLLLVYGLVSSILYSNFTWYSYFVVGTTLFFAFINYLLKNDSLFEKNLKYLLKTYLTYILFTILIEVIGRFILHFWYYPHFNYINQLVHVLLIGYPFAFFSIYEFYKIINKYILNSILAVIVVTILCVFTHELPNIYSWEWIYTIPYIKFNILNINIIVIIGWVFLILVPLLTRRIVK